MMKEFKLENMSPVEETKTKIWSIFNILRSYNISSDDYDVVLFLLSAYKDGLTLHDVVWGEKGSIIPGSGSIKDRFFRNLYGDDKKLTNRHIAIFQAYGPILMLLREKG